MRLGNMMLGVIISVIGVILLLNNLDIVSVDFGVLWPIFVLIPGLLFELSYFLRGRDPGLLVPGGILTTYGSLFFINTIFGWHLMQYLWPIFPLGVAIGLFQLYLFGGRETALFVVSMIIGGFSIIALSFTLMHNVIGTIAPLLLIAVGVMLIFKRR